MADRNSNFRDSALYHGTSHPFEIGDIIEPRHIEPTNPYNRPSDAKAWATPNADAAFSFGSRRTGKAAKVFQVAPIEPSEPKYLNDDPNSGQVYSKKGFKVVKRVK
jgi:hypothetical protein